MKRISEWARETQNITWRHMITVAVILLCASCVAAFLCFCVYSYNNPYMMNEIIDLSEGWQYETEQAQITVLPNLRSGPKLNGGEVMTLYRTLDAGIKEAAILVRANHQTVNVYLDDSPLYLDAEHVPGENPGMALHFIPLPDGYFGKTLKIELSSPYAVYAGRTSPILLGTIPSLEAHTLSRSMRSLVLMPMCLLLGFCVIILTFLQALNGVVRWQNMALGVFAVIWALYYICTENIMFQFFDPVMVSTISLGLYYTFQFPLALYFFFSFRRYKKWMLPAAILHSSFGVLALLLQLFGIADLPRLLHINNLLLAGLMYTIALSALEAATGNRMMALSTPFLVVAYVSMLHNFEVFYSRHGVVPYSYRDTYFLLILVVLVCNIWQFFSRYHREQRDNEVLVLQNQQARNSYEQIKTHLQEVGGLKHEIKNHFTALGTYLSTGRYDEAKRYLDKYAKQSTAVTDTVYHENFIINAVVGSLLKTAREQDIEIELNLNATPVDIAEPDLYSLLSNILENALEACTDVPKDERRFINLTLSRREPYFAITCVNSRTGELLFGEDGMQTTKQRGRHGYGLSVIRQIAEAYEGLVDMEYDKSSFTLTIILK